MSINFLEVQSNEKLVSGNRWRNGIFVLMIVFVSCALFFRYSNISLNEKLNGLLENRFLSWRINNKLAINTLENEKIENGQGGGDAILPPKNTTPFLIEDAVDLSPESFTASSLIVKDKKSSMILYSKNETEPRSLASITKLMSALVLLDFSLDWNSTTTASKDEVFDVAVVPGVEYKMENLWQATLIGSSNQAILSMVGATGLSREEFVNKMNEKALYLGMKNTTFSDATGLDEKNISTAGDIVLLLDSALQQEKINKSLLTKEFDLKDADGLHLHHMWNTDWVLIGWIPHNFFAFHGGKTGYIPSAGYNFTMEVENEKGVVLQVAVLGASSNETRFTEARNVAEWVFKNYIWPDKMN